MLLVFCLGLGSWSQTDALRHRPPSQGLTQLRMRGFKDRQPQVVAPLGVRLVLLTSTRLELPTTNLQRWKPRCGGQPQSLRTAGTHTAAC